MKIAIDISQIAYPGTGVANYTVNLVKNVLGKDHENEYILFGISLRQLDILDNYYNEVKRINDRVTRKFLPMPQTLGNFLWNKLHKIHIERFLGKIDIFHSSDWIQPPTFARKITTVHDMIVYRFPETSQSEIIDTQKKRLEWVRKECDVILTDSLASKKDIVDILRLIPEKISVVYPGIGEDFRRVNDEEILRIKQKYGLPDQYLLSVGTREPRKNLKRVIQSFDIFSRHPLVKAQRAPVILVLVGKSGWEEFEIKSDKVKILGFIPNNDLPALYSGANMFIYPSLYEGFGIPVIEAMACGCPVISSRRGSLKEIVNDSGLVVDPIDTDDIALKMVQLFIDNDLRADLIEKGFKNAALFSWVSAADRIINIYNKIYA